MITKIIRILGIFIIVSFSALSIMFAIAEREASLAEKKIYDYSTFFENRFYDIRMNFSRDTQRKDHTIVLADIDDASLEKVGRWPWSRSTWAKVINKLKIYGAKVVAFDVIFSEPEVACNAESPDTLLRDAISDFQSVKDNKIILTYMLEQGLGPNTYETTPDTLLSSIIDTEQAPGANLFPWYINRTTFPLPTLLEAEPMIGFIGFNPDPDGIFRHYPFLINTKPDDLYFPSLGLSAYLAYTGNSVKLGISEANGVGTGILRLPNGNLSLNSKGESKIRWHGAEENFGRVPLHKIISGKDDDQELINALSGKLIFVASTAGGAHDIRHLPIGSLSPGVLTHMNAVNMMMEGRYFTDEDTSALISWGILVVGTLFIILIQLLGHAFLDLFAVAAITSLATYIDTFILLPRGFQIQLFFSLFCVVSTYSWNTFLNFYIATKEKAKIRGTFSRYVAPAIVNQMLSNPEKLKVGGEKKNITVFFSDVRDFTSISEKLTPTQLATCLNQYMGVMTNIIFKHFGTLDKYIGDAIVAYWGAPIELDNHPFHAINAAIEMIEALPAINDNFRKNGFPEFRHGIGLNTGDCSVGNMGSDLIFSYTALGDHMNLGARLESLCKYYGVQLNVSEFTIGALTEEQRKTITYRILDKVKVKGKDKTVTIYEVLHPSHPLKKDPVALEDYKRAFDMYLNREFVSAETILKAHIEKFQDDKPAKHLLENCEVCIANPPGESWDGVNVMKTK